MLFRSKEKIQGILDSRGEQIEGSRFMEVGLANVNRRIKLICGSEYGLGIESSEGEYTKVMVKLPAGSTSKPIKDNHPEKEVK